MSPPPIERKPYELTAETLRTMVRAKPKTELPLFEEEDSYDPDFSSKDPLDPIFSWLRKCSAKVKEFLTEGQPTASTLYDMITSVPADREIGALDMLGLMPFAGAIKAKKILTRGDLVNNLVKKGYPLKEATEVFDWSDVGEHVLAYRQTREFTHEPGFRSMDIAPHFGSFRQADAFRKGGEVPASQTGMHEVLLNIKTPLKLPDIGTHSNPNNWLRSTEVRQNLDPEELLELQRLVGSGNWTGSNEREFFRKLKDAFINKGYDSIIYENVAEGPGLSYIPLLGREQVKVLRAIPETQQVLPASRYMHRSRSEVGRFLDRDVPRHPPRFHEKWQKKED